METITHVDVRMYTAGTGDCFVLKFFNSDASPVFTMMIDGGTINKKHAHPIPYVKNIKEYVKNKLDVLVITHEHQDHVQFFAACEDLFTDDDFEVEEVWMAWTENDDSDIVKQWKKDFGQKKKALAMAADKLEEAFKSRKFQRQYTTNKKQYTDTGKDPKKYEHFNKDEIITNHKYLSNTLMNFKSLHFSDDNTKYIGGQKGMEVVKKKIKKKRIRYFNAGDTLELPNLPGMKFYILGPPDSFDFVKKTKGKKGSNEAYSLNLGVDRSNSFASVITEDGGMQRPPFDATYCASTKKDDEIKKDNRTKKANKYYNSIDRWRSIDYDWLVTGAGQLALRVKRGLNNLSLVMAIEFETSKKVMLFPGDAEIGSWESWYTIDWNSHQKGKTHLTEDLLRRTVFYKTAHHNSKFGTAKEKGLEMMTSPELVIMTTLDYDNILSGWKSTMPNSEMLNVMLAKTKGRLILMNEKDLFVDKEKTIKLSDAIKTEQQRLTQSELDAFEANFEKDDLFKQYRVKA